MQQAIQYLEGDLSGEYLERYRQWRHDDAGCDLVQFMDGLSLDDVTVDLLWALQECVAAESELERLGQLREGLNLVHSGLQKLGFS